METSNKILLQAVRNGSQDAWSQIVNLYSGRLYAFAKNQLGRRRSDAEDMVQETFLALLQQTAQAETIHSLEAYLFTILRRRIIDFRRKKKPQQITDTRWERKPLTPGETPSHVVAQAESQRASREMLAASLRDHLETLKGKGAYESIAALELLFLLQWNGRQTAKKLGLTPVQVTRIKNAALGFLKNRSEGFTLPQETTFKELWEEHLLTCLKRSTLGAYRLGALPEDLARYVHFHLKELKCPFCTANLEDMEEQSKNLPELRERIFATSTPFLRRK